MKPFAFAGSNTVFAENQPPYWPLPAHMEKSQSGRVTSCWRLTWRERVKVLLTGRLWLQQLTFNRSLQPQLPLIDSPTLR